MAKVPSQNDISRRYHGSTRGSIARKSSYVRDDVIAGFHANS